MFYLKNQIIFIALFCIFSNFISTLNAGKDANNVDEGESLLMSLPEWVLSIGYTIDLAVDKIRSRRLV